MYKVRNALKRLLLGPVNFPQTVTLGLQAPQSRVAVRLHGLGADFDVTQNHMLASCAPLTICIGFDPKQAVNADLTGRFTLCFHEQEEEQRLLGKIGLRFVSSIRVGERKLCFFQMTHYKNLSLSPLHLWAHHLQYARTYEPERNQDVPITLREARAMIVFYLCPRPVALVTVIEGRQGNMFPMNLMGHVGGGYFAFALNSQRCAAPLVDRVRQVTLSTVPLQQAAVASKMGANHRKPSIDWGQLPFPTITPEGVHAPIPAFALGVREMQVVAAHPLGSHTLFVAKTMTEQRFANGPEFFTAHGLYRAWL
jgi:flavin reductase (DIM6/NTAB) family NADH-FMN oxidoreductase RutF